MVDVEKSGGGDVSPPRSCSNNACGFTLIEIMITVAIIGILSAIAIPQFVKYTKRTRTAEAMSHVHTIYSALADWYSSPDLGNGVFLDTTADNDNIAGNRTFADHFPSEANWIDSGDKNYEYSISSTEAAGGRVPLVIGTARNPDAVFGVLVKSLTGGQATVISVSGSY